MDCVLSVLMVLLFSCHNYCLIIRHSQIRIGGMTSETEGKAKGSPKLPYSQRVKRKRGGARPGAGRPKGTFRSPPSTTIRVAKAVADQCRQIDADYRGTPKPKTLVEVFAAEPKCVVKSADDRFTRGMWRGTCGAIYEEQPENKFCPECGREIEVKL
jgi:hypothetical protein